MSASLLEALQGLVTPALLKTATSTLGEGEGALTSGLGAIVSKILSALVSGAGDQSLMNTVADLVTTQSRDPGALSDVAGLLSSNSAAIPGNQLIGSLFGVKEGGIAQAAAAAAGLKPQSGASLMALASPLVLSGLGKAAGGGLTGAALSGLLNTQRASLLGSLAPAAAAASSAATADVAAVKQAATTAAAAPVAAAATAATAAAAAVQTAAKQTASATTTAATTATAAVDEETGGAGMGWLIWPLLLFALAGIGYFLWETKYSELKSAAPAPMKVEEKKAAPAAAPAPEKKAEAPAPAPAAAPAAVPAPEPAPAAVSAPDASAMIKIELPGGTTINAAAAGVESKLVNFLTDANSVIDKKTWFDFDRLNFETGSTNLTPESQFQVTNIASIMKAFATAAIKIGGYTDNVGQPESNLKLSDERAKAVMAAIVGHDIAAERVEAEGYGEQFPVESNDTAEGRAKNRRTALSVRAR